MDDKLHALCTSVIVFNFSVCHLTILSVFLNISGTSYATLSIFGLIPSVHFCSDMSKTMKKLDLDFLKLLEYYLTFKDAMYVLIKCRSL